MALCIFIPSKSVKTLSTAFTVNPEEIVYKDSGLLVCDIDHAPKTVSIYTNDRFHLVSSYPFLALDDPLNGTNSRTTTEDIVRSIVDRETTPQFGVVIDKQERRFVIFNDNLGLARAYNTVGHRLGCVVGDNSVLIAERFGRPSDWSLNFYSLVVLAAVGWIPGDSTLINGVSQLLPGTEISGSSRDQSSGTHCVVNGLREVYKKIVAYTQAPDPIDSVLSSMKSVVSQLSVKSGRPITCSITGGRDSRIVASLLLSQGVSTNFVTKNNFTRETRIAKELLDPYLSQSVKFQVSEPACTPGLVQRAFNPNSADLMFRATGGFFEPAYIGESSAQFEHLKGRLALSGLGGELTHGFYYPQHVSEFGAADIIRSLTQRLTGWSFNRERAQSIVMELIRAEYERYLACIALTSVKLPDYKFLDHFYFINRLRRWSAVALQRGTVAPLACMEFISYSLSLTLGDIADNNIPREMVRRFDRRWAQIEFFKQKQGEQRNWPTAAVDPLAGLPYCENSEAVRLIYGEDYHKRLTQLSIGQGATARAIVSRILACNAVERWFSGLSQVGIN